MKGSDIGSYTSPLVLIKDTPIQRKRPLKGKSYPAPCKVSAKSFNILTIGVRTLPVRARFAFISQPAYRVFDDAAFKGRQRSFWKPVLKRKLPIYIVSPFFGLIWPGENIGTYKMVMEETFLMWRQQQLWRVVLELFENNKCDCVFSYLPPLYDNVVRVENTPWYVFKPEQFIEHEDILLKLSLNRYRNASYKQKRECPHTTIYESE